MTSIASLEKVLEDVSTMPPVQEIHVRTNEEFDEVLNDIYVGLVVAGCEKREVVAFRFLHATRTKVECYVRGQHKYTVIKAMADGWVTGC